MFIILKLIQFYSSEDRNSIYLPQKPDLKNETVMKKSESACILNSQNNIKHGINNKMINNFNKKKMSKSWVDSIMYLNV